MGRWYWGIQPHPARFHEIGASIRPFGSSPPDLPKSLHSSPVKAFDLPSQLLARVQPKLFARSQGGLRPFLD